MSQTKYALDDSTGGEPQHDWAKTNIFKDFDINAKGTINLLELTNYLMNTVHDYCVSGDWKLKEKD